MVNGMVSGPKSSFFGKGTYKSSFFSFYLLVATLENLPSAAESLAFFHVA